jgi:hypothetical protein
MGLRPRLRPTQDDEKSLRPATTLYRTVALPFVISTGAQRSLCGCLFLEMFFDGAKPRDLRFRGLFLEMFSSAFGYDTETCGIHFAIP